MKKRVVSVLLLTVLLVGILSSASLTPALAQPSQTPSAKWCGRLSSYTSWYRTPEGYWKPVLWVWKGQGSGNPTSVSVWFNGNSVPNSDSGVQTWSGPQVDQYNGWVGYYIAKRIWLAQWTWDDDGRWEVRGCIP